MNIIIMITNNGFTLIASIEAKCMMNFTNPFFRDGQNLVLGRFIVVKITIRFYRVSFSEPTVHCKMLPLFGAQSSNNKQHVQLFAVKTQIDCMQNDIKCSTFVLSIVKWSFWKSKNDFLMYNMLSVFWFHFFSASMMRLNWLCDDSNECWTLTWSQLPNLNVCYRDSNLL